MTDETPRALGSRYELLDRLGKGAMGEVWRARDRTTGEQVAAKLLRSDLAHDHDIIARFIQERAILVSLHHPNIVRVRDLVVEGDNLAIVMDLVEGEDLGRLLRAQGTLTPQDAITVSCAVLDALAGAHAQRCLHRDVKPDNVLLTRTSDLAPDAVRLSDFSIARLAHESTVQSTGMLGTPGYMPPELIRFGRFGATSDVYAAGVLLYQLLAGRTPFAGSGTSHTVTFRHVESMPPVLPVAPELWSVLAQMLDKDPTRRLPAAETAAALRALPPEVLAGPRIPVQPEPSEWARAVQPAGDPTVVRSWPSGPTTGPPGSTGGTGSAVGASWAGATGGPLTGPPVGPPMGLTPGGPSVRAANDTGSAVRRRWPWAVAAAAVVAVVAVVAGVALSGGGGSAQPPGDPGDPGTGTSPTSTSADQADRILPSGLTVSRSATYDPSTAQVDLKLTFGADGTALKGPFLVVIPAVGGRGNCPLVAFTGAVAHPNIPESSGIATPCAWSLAPPPLPVHGSRVVDATMTLHLGDQAGALMTWLDKGAAATTSALTGLTQGAGFPVQRLQRIDLSIIGNTPSTRLLGQRIPMVIYPDWGDGPDHLDPIFDSRTFDPSAPSSVLAAVGGGARGLSFDSCAAAPVQNRWYVGAASAVRACGLRVTMGELRTRISFQIHGSGS